MRMGPPQRQEREVGSSAFTLRNRPDDRSLKRELEDRPAGGMISTPNRSAVSLDDLSDDRESHPHTAGLGRVEGLEDRLLGPLSHTRAGVLDADVNRARVLGGAAPAY